MFVLLKCLRLGLVLFILMEKLMIVLNVLINYWILRIIVLFKFFLLKYNNVLILCKKYNIFVIFFLLIFNILFCWLLIFVNNFWDMIFCIFFFCKIFLKCIYIGWICFIKDVELCVSFVKYFLMFIKFFNFDFVFGKLIVNVWLGCRCFFRFG